MTTPTEEERKAAAEKISGILDTPVHASNYVEHEFYGIHGGLVDLQIQLTRTEKRLEEAEGLLELAIQYIGGHKTEYGEDCPRRECNEHNFRLITVLDKLRSFNPPAEGE